MYIVLKTQPGMSQEFNKHCLSQAFSTITGCPIIHAR